MDENKTPVCVWLSLVAIVLSLLTIGFTIGSLVTRTSALEPEPAPSRIAEARVLPEPVATEYAELPEAPPEIISLGEFKITHYCPCPICCGEWADGITYTGTQATEGRTIAVDPDVIPLGSTVEIDGQQYIAEDIGGAIQGNRIDIYMASHEAAEVAGVKYSEVYILKEA